ncbi:MAG: DUF4124 domain-containing protein [Pseudomonadota bacterium]
MGPSTHQDSTGSNTWFTGLLILCILLVLSAPYGQVQADTYRWVDANGVVNYSERKPRNIPEEQITRVASAGSTRTSTPTENPSTPSTNATPAPSTNNDLTEEQQVMLKRLEDAEAQRQQAVREIKQDNCAKSRRALEDLTAKERVRINLADGSQRTLGEDERQEFIAQAQQGIVRNCENS